MNGSRREFLKWAGGGSLGLLTARLAGALGDEPVTPAEPKAAGGGASPAGRPNILMLVADDMNWDAVGCFGSPVKDATPNIDRLAGAGLRFERAHVTIAVCQPSRSAIMTGRYPHRNGAEGFEPIDTELTTLPERLAASGYLNGILGKVVHLAPFEKFQWSMAYDMKDLGSGRDPEIYGRYAAEFFRRAVGEGRPFFLMANSHDPHRPFHGTGFPNAPAPSRVYTAEEIEVPGFLPPLEGVRTEVAQYYSSVRRCDDTVGAVLAALDKAGLAGNTLVLFFSDNGMAFPYSKTNCYLNSTRTPLIVRWPGKVAPGTVEGGHFVSGIDFMPTLLDAAGLAQDVDGMDGRSFMPLMRGEEIEGGEMVFTQFHETSARARFPIRAVQDGRFGYIFNPWADGQRVFKNESQSGLTFNAMAAAAATNSEVAGRVEFFRHRVLEELYDLEQDPDALHNLMEDPAYEKEVERLRGALIDWMRRTEDPALAALERHTPEALKEFMTQQEQRTQTRVKKQNVRGGARRG